MGSRNSHSRNNHSSLAGHNRSQPFRHLPRWPSQAAAGLPVAVLAGLVLALPVAAWVAAEAASQRAHLPAA